MTAKIATAARASRAMFTFDSLKPAVWDYQLENMLWRGEITDYEVLYSVVWDVLFHGYLNVEVQTIRKLPDGLSDLAETLATLIWARVHK